MYTEDNMVEDNIIQNFKENYNRCMNKKITLQDLQNINTNIYPQSKKSIYLFNINGRYLDIKSKCNHIFLYNCESLVLKINDCISGITCINSKYCNLLFNRVPNYNIEISNSFNINLRSLFFSTPMFFNNTSFNLVKSVYCVVNEYISVHDPFFSNWKYNYFNF